MGHLRYFLSKHHDRRPVIHNYLNKAEAVFAFEEEQDKPLREALIILLGGGLEKDQIRAGVERLEEFNKRWVGQYIARLEAATLHGRAEKLNPGLKKYVDQPEEAEVAA